MKTWAAVGIAVGIIGLAHGASAQTRVPAPHAETAAALKCLLDHDYGEKCVKRFGGSALRPALFWLWWTPGKDIELGPLLSAEYAGSEAPNAYITKFLSGRTADVYDVRFRHHRRTFYIVPPGPDGKILYMRFRDGGPDDERLDLFEHGPG